MLLAIAGCFAVAGCGVTRYQVAGEIPAPMVSPLPLSVALRLPKAFADYVQKEELDANKVEIALGAAQSVAFRRVATAMFQHALVLGDESAGDAAQMAAGNVSALIELSVDSYVYLQPASGGSEYYSATIAYKLDVRTPDGKVLGSWIYEGYGSVPARGAGQKEGIIRSTALAIRDACANIAVHLPQQEIVQNLISPAPSATNGTPAT
jgi:hypothetical protein